MPESQMYMVSTTTEMIAVAAIESATPSASLSVFDSSVMSISEILVFKAAHYTSIGINPKAEPGLFQHGTLSPPPF